MIGGRLSALLAVLVACTTASCGGKLDAGRNAPHGPLPVDERNPVIIENDNVNDNWMGEYSLLLANQGALSIAGVIVCSSNYWPDLNSNVMGWTKLVNAARGSGLVDIPDVTVSAGAPLVAPADAQIDSTLPNNSTGAQRIIELSRQLSKPSRPVVVLVGTQLTDLADAYLVDHTVVDRVVVVAALGSLMAPKALMTGPNGDLDPWADWIVAHRYQYIQVTAFYDQTQDVKASDLGNLPQTPLGDWIAQKQPGISPLPQASDQITVLTTALPQFATTVQRVSPDASAKFGSPKGQGPPLVPDDTGNARVVTKIAAPLAASAFWQMLLEPHAVEP